MYKSMLFAFAVLTASLGSYAQNRSDIGVLVTPPLSYAGVFAIEYRSPLNDKYKLKLGLVATTSNSPYFYEDSKIVHASDSLILERRFTKTEQSGGFRIGVEKQLGSSFFSLIGDLNISYLQQRSAYYNSVHQLVDSTWTQQETTSFPDFEDPSQSQIARHFINPALRVGISMDIPLNKYFSLNLFAAGNFGLPIYIGESKKRDPMNEFSSYATTFDFDQQIGIGLRFKLPEKK